MALKSTQALGVDSGGTGKTGITADRMLIATATDVYSETPYKDGGDYTYTGTDTWGGTTPPSGASTKVVEWQRIGNKVYYSMLAVYAVQGVANTQVAFTLDPLMPTPKDWAALGNSSKIYPAYGYIDTTVSANPPASRATIQKDASGVWLAVVVAASQNARIASIAGSYRV